MCTLEEFKNQNKEEHTQLRMEMRLLQRDVKASIGFSKTVKWVAGLLLVIIIALLSSITYFVRDTNESHKARYATELKTYKAISELSDTISDHWDRTMAIYTGSFLPHVLWSKATYDSVTLKNKARSINNADMVAAHEEIFLQNGLK